MNYALQPLTRESFVELVTADQPEAPAYFTYDAVLNSRQRPTLDEALARVLRPLSLDECLAAGREGAQLLDTRDAAEFAAAQRAENALRPRQIGERAPDRHHRRPGG